MVKVTFVEALAQTSKAGKAYWRVKTNDGKEGSVFFQPTLNAPVDVDEKYSADFKNYSWFAPREGGAGGFQKKGVGSYAPARATLRSSALLAAAHTVEKVTGIVKREEVEALAEKFFAWINKAEEPAQGGII